MNLFERMEASEMIFPAAILAVICMLLMRIRRRVRRQKKTRTGMVRTDRPESEDRGHHIGLPAEAMKWEVEMHETARDLSAQLDSKMSALGHLIREADRASARLEKALESIGDRLQPLESFDNRPDSTPAGGTPTETQIDQLARDEIYTLSDYGFNTHDIASRVDLPISDVESILASRTKR